MNKHNDSVDKNDKSERQKEKLLNEEKNKVKEQIDDLEKLISDIELQLELIPYGEYEILGKLSLSDSESQSLISGRQNIQDILQYELFTISGCYCSKITEDEFIFNFSPSSNIEAPYAIQIFLKEDKVVQLGGWVMPWGITIDRIESQTPLQCEKDIVPFLKNCQRIIDCHSERMRQVEELKKITLSIKNVRIDATLGYITIVCYFLNVLDNSTNKIFNLTVNLNYGIGRVRPTSINIEWNLKGKLSEQTIIKMKTFVKCFKTQNLMDAFTTMMEQTHSIYIWKVEKYIDSVLDMTNIDFSSDNDSNTEILEDEHAESSRKRKSVSVLRKPDAKPFSNSDKTDKTSNQTIEDAVNFDECRYNNEFELSQNASHSKWQPKKRTKKISSSPVKSKVEIQSKPMKNTRSAPRQTGLSFKGIAVNSVPIGKNKKTKRRKNAVELKKTMTSTPMALRFVANKHQSTINSLEISPIVEIKSAKVNSKSHTNNTVTQNKRQK